MAPMAQLHPDSELIETLGGAASLARQLNEAEGTPDKYDVQRVSNWKVRGIPAAVKLLHHDLLVVRASQSDDFDPDSSFEPSGK